MVDQVTVQKQVVVQEAKLKDFCNKVWMKLGVPAQDARITTDVLVLADLRGIESHGVARLPRYYTDLKNGWTKPTDQSKIVKETKATAMIDGAQSLGQVVGHKAMELAIKKAKETAVGIVSVRNSHHYGIAGYYSLMTLEHDLIGMSMTNAAPLVVPTFGRNAILGTNPISMTAPAGKEKAFVLDMATSVVPRGKLEVYDRQGKKVPLGWAVDKTGRGTDDAHAVLDAVQEIGRRDSTPRRRRRRALWPQRVWSGLDGGRSERGLERCGNGSRCRCQQGKTERRPLLHGLGSSGVSTIGRVQERHGPAGPRVEGLAKSGGTIANLRSRREELCKDGKVPERGYPIGSQGCRSHETSGDGDRRSLAWLVSALRDFFSGEE